MTKGLTACREINRILFYLAYTLYFISNYIQYYTAVSDSSILRIVGFGKYVAYLVFLVLLGWRLVTSDNPIIEKVFIWLVLIFCIGYQVITHDANSIVMVLIISYAFYEGDVREFAWWNLILNILLYLFTLSTVPLGIAPNIINGGDIKFGIERMRNACGFNYPGQLAMSLLPIMFLYYYLRNRKITVFDNIFWIVLSVLAFCACQTFMAFFISIVFIIYFSISNKKDAFCRYKERYYDYLIPYISYLCMAVNCILTWLYYVKNPIGVLIDRIVSHRLNMNCEGIEQFGITLLGSGYQNGTSLGWYLYFDSEYFFMLMSNGIIYTVVALVLWKWSIEYSIRINERNITIIFCFMAINAIVNNGIFNLLFLPFMIILYPAIDFKVHHLKKYSFLDNENYSGKRNMA